jgi:hypothetical protein
MLCISLSPRFSHNGGSYDSQAFLWTYRAREHTDRVRGGSFVERTRATWYEPFEEQRDIDAAVQWVLARPGMFLATVGDIHLLPKVLDAASRFTSAPDDQTMRDQSARLEMLPLFV